MGAALGLLQDLVDDAKAQHAGIFSGGAAREHAIYSVISPEAASSILWRDGTKAQEVANSLKITAQDMIRRARFILRHTPAGSPFTEPGKFLRTLQDIGRLNVA